MAEQEIAETEDYEPQWLTGCPGCGFDHGHEVGCPENVAA